MAALHPSIDEENELQCLVSAPLLLSRMVLSPLCFLLSVSYCRALFQLPFMRELRLVLCISPILFGAHLNIYMYIYITHATMSPRMRFKSEIPSQVVHKVGLGRQVGEQVGRCKWVCIISIDRDLNLDCARFRMIETEISIDRDLAQSRMGSRLIEILGCTSDFLLSSCNWPQTMLLLVQHLQHIKNTKIP